MHFSVEANVPHDVPPITLQGAAVVVQVDTTDPTDQAIGKVRGKPSGEPAILAVLSPAVDHVVALFELFHDEGDILRVILKVRIQRNDDLSPGVIKSGGNGGGLPEVTNKLEDTHPPIQAGQALEFLGAPIGAAIVDEEDFTTGFPGGQASLEAIIKGFESLKFVENWNDDGKLKSDLRGLFDW